MSYLVADIFMTVFESTVSTIFLCFCEDLERNNGSASAPYFMSESLQKLLSHRSEALVGEKEKADGGF
jgi:choline transporter-like protein 2/4/5